ncbi:MAG: efflux RND transporter periplasmic adaptor subunit [Nannocystaceae bacterium]
MRTDDRPKKSSGPRLRPLARASGVALLSLAAACGDAGAEADVEEPRDVPRYVDGAIRMSPKFAENIGLKIGEAREIELEPVVYVTGVLELNELRIAAVGSRISGRVRQVHVVEGSEVQVGDPLATLDSAELGEAQAEILAMRARARVADSDEARKRKLMSQGIASKRAAELASQTSSVADAELMAARQRVKALGGDSHGKNIGILSLTSPIEGEVIAVHVFRGQAVMPSHTAFTIGDYDQLWVRLAVFERELTNIREGDEVEIRPVATPELKITGQVDYISRMLDPGTRAAEVRVVVPNEEGRLRVGQGVTAGIHASGSKHRALAVPRDSVVQVDGKPTVFVAVEDTAFVPRAIKTGIRDPDLVEVLEGLEPGERVVTEGVFAIKSETFR